MFRLAVLAVARDAAMGDHGNSYREIDPEQLETRDRSIYRQGRCPQAPSLVALRHRATGFRLGPGERRLSDLATSDRITPVSTA